MTANVKAAALLAVVSCGAALGQTYTVNTVAGGGLPVNVPGTSSSLGFVNGVAIDPSGNLYLADSVYSILLRRDAASGMLGLVAGNGLHGYSGDNGPSTSAQLALDDEFLVDFDNSVTGIAIDSSGNIYIADTLNSRVRMISNGVITTVAGNGTSGYSGDNGPATGAQLSAPRGVAVDSSGNLYIADNISFFNGVVRKVSNGIITTVAGGGSDSADLGDNGPASSAHLSTIYGIAVDSSGNLYIADTYDNRIREVASGVITTIAGTGSQGFSGDNGPATSAELSLPYNVAVDGSGNIYIADTVNGRIRRVTNGIVTTVAGGGSILGDGGPATSASLGLPVAVACDANGNIFVAGDGYPGNVSNRIREVAAGTIATLAGGGNSVGDNGPATGGQLFLPGAVSADSSGNFYVADSYNRIVRKVSNGTISTVAGGGSSTADDVPATTASLNGPESIAVDAHGNLYFADALLIGVIGAVREVSNGVISTAVSEAQLNGYTPTAVAVDPSGNLYVAASSLYGPTVVQELSNGTLTTVAGSGTSIQLGTSVGGLAFDRLGNLYIADTYTYRVLKVSNGTASVVAGVGTNGFSGDNGPAGSAQLSDVGGIALDSNGSLFIDDWGNRRIRKVSNGIITTIAGTGNEGFAGDGGMAVSAEFDGAFGGVAADSTGTIYVADTYNQRIRILQPAALQPALSVSVSHVGNFSEGQVGATYQATVSNGGMGPSAGAVTLTEIVPPGFTLIAMAGNGWTCPASSVSCTRSDTLLPGASYPPVIVNVNVAANATSPQVNGVTVIGGGSATANITDPTTIVVPATNIGATGLYVSSAQFVGEYDANSGTPVNANLIAFASFGQPALLGNTLYLANYTAGTVSTYNATTGAAIDANFISGLQNPDGLAVSGNTLFVANQTRSSSTFVPGTIGAYDATTGAVINATFVTGLSSPGNLAVSGSTLFVVNGDMGPNLDTIGAYDVVTGVAINSRLLTLFDPTGIAASGSTLFVSNFDAGAAGGGTVGAYNTTTGAVIDANLITGLNGPEGLAVSGNKVFVASIGTANIGTVGAYDAGTGVPINPTMIGGLYFPFGLAIAGYSSACDTDQIGITNVTDVQALVNQALGVTSPIADLSRSGSVTVVDVQVVLNSALGLGCSAM
ncbi:MAG TPA: hypothetical protein VMB03_22165 [Bryobacteraceae bacterium]|nr:hypothetical protein [Bryobacteraceae bacterium]